MFDSKDKLIFEFCRGRDASGDVKVYADPLAAWRNLVRALDGDAQGAIEAIQPQKFLDDKGGELPEPPPSTLQRIEAEERLLAGVRKAFGIMPFDSATGLGGTDEHCWAAINSYLEWTSGEKTGTEPESLPTSSVATDSAPSPSITGCSSASS